MSLTSRTGKANRSSLQVRIFAFFSIFVLIATQFVLPSKAIAFRSVRADIAAPKAAPPEPFVVGGGGAGTRLLSSVPSVTGMLASLADSFTSAFPPAVVAPAPFMPSASAFDLAKLRLNPKNATGGTDLYSQNFGWGTSLVGLPGVRVSVWDSV